MKLRCYECWKDWDAPKGYRSNVCNSCMKPKEIGTSLLMYENLPGYGRVLKSRLNEMARRVIVSDKSDKTSYHCGRLGENGKIAEREPSY
jgi:hypothetical protein